MPPTSAARASESRLDCVALRGARAPSPPLTLLAGCGGGDDEAVKTLTIAVNAPFSRSPYVGETIARGVELGASRAA